MKLKLNFKVKQNPTEVFGKFNRELFLALAPPFPPAKLLRFDGCSKGDVVELLLGFPPFQSRWISNITSNEQSEKEIWFIDEGAVLPFFLKNWQHKHLIQTNGNGSIITEDIDFEAALWLPNWLVYPALYMLFNYRGPVYQRFFGKPD